MSLLNGVMRFFGADDDEYDSEHIVDFTQAEKAGEPLPPAEADSQLITMPEPVESTVYIARPEREDAGKANFSLTTYAEYLHNRQAMILDINELARHDLEEAQRVVDFLTGAVQMVGGQAWEITKNIFVFAPQGVNLAGDQVKPVEVF